MSMLSEQCEKLRERAKELRMLSDGLSAPYVVPSTKETMYLSMRSAATEAERAANTIESLSDKCATLGDQNDAHEHDFVRNGREYMRVRDENDALRELVRDMWEIIGDFEETPYVKERHGKNPAVTWLDEDWEPIEECKRRMRELGIEVDE